MAESSSPKSNVPLHLHPFLRPSFTTEPFSTQAPYSYTLSTPQRKTPELCPPHWRRIPKPGFRKTLKSIILKDLHSNRLHYSPPKPASREGRPVMRMRDSDDYITARAANPRTGLISPSIGSPSPRPPGTPDSPADALKRQAGDVPESPTLDVKARPALRRACVSKRPHPQDPVAWVVDGQGWLTDVYVTSPKVTAVDVDAGLYVDKPLSRLNEDAFIVHMPSAREPQPYAFPGYSARQIEAFQHYQRKARQVSGEGYGRRVSSGRQKASNEVAMTSQQVNGIAEVQPATFAPFSSPKTPHSRAGDSAGTVLKTISQPCRHEYKVVTPLSRKPVQNVQGKDDLKVQESPGASSSKPATTTPPPQPDIDLRRLPRVRLLHPSLASVTSHNTPEHADPDFSLRQCSLGCRRDADSNICLRPRLASGDSVTPARRVLFDDDDNVAQPSLEPSIGDATSQPGSLLVEILIMGIMCLASLGKQVRFPALPKFCALDTLSAGSATPREKAKALKTVVATAGRAVLFLMLAALVWQIGTATVRCLQLLCWPLMIPLKVLRWLCLGL